MEGLLERSAVLAELGNVARQVARGGAGRLVLVRGEAGVGKTAVLDHFAAKLDSSMRVLRGWCDPLVAPRPLGPLIDALAGVGPAAAGALDAAIQSGDTGVLYRRLLAVLRDGRTWVWVIEDAHWADGATGTGITGGSGGNGGGVLDGGQGGGGAFAGGNGATNAVTAGGGGGGGGGGGIPGFGGTGGDGGGAQVDAGSSGNLYLGGGDGGTGGNPGGVPDLISGTGGAAGIGGGGGLGAPVVLTPGNATGGAGGNGGG
ncbi:ATP-binding protein [Mycobacterium sp. 1081908.1]|uniref:ATP-binding protein n=1 Tax=Mycobacterium sp. 1081908.1 TaxID=1834066 RepID=UPI0007FBB33A|nr:ATP-binding protein [Mycobacterium sp. 1081908.1]OBK53751.1 hypothetical protein A5655_18290 [Mycobacterium sp. 1081908.1]